MVLEVVISKLYCYHNSLTYEYNFIFFRILSHFIQQYKGTGVRIKLSDSFTKYVFSNGIYK